MIRTHTPKASETSNRRPVILRVPVSLLLFIDRHGGPWAVFAGQGPPAAAPPACVPTSSPRANEGAHPGPYMPTSPHVPASNTFTRSIGPYVAYSHQFVVESPHCTVSHTHANNMHILICPSISPTAMMMIHDDDDDTATQCKKVLCQPPTCPQA